MSVLCTICARGGSKGVPSKNIRELHGKPLIAYTIQKALNFSLIDKVIVSTDSEKIAEVARQYGAEVPFIRPDHLATDAAPKLPVVQHAVRYCIDNKIIDPDYVIDFDPTSPLRSNDDIKRCLDLIMNDPDCDSVITGSIANKNPYFNMIEVDIDGIVHLSKPTKKEITRRQEAPAVFDMNAAIYAWKTKAMLDQVDLFFGKIKFVEMPKERSVDIDNEIDFKLVALMMEEKLVREDAKT